MTRTLQSFGLAFAVFASVAYRSFVPENDDAQFNLRAQGRPPAEAILESNRARHTRDLLVVDDLIQRCYRVMHVLATSH